MSIKLLKFTSSVHIRSVHSRFHLQHQLRIHVHRNFDVSMKCEQAHLLVEDNEKPFYVNVHVNQMFEHHMVHWPRNDNATRVTRLNDNAPSIGNCEVFAWKFTRTFVLSPKKLEQRGSGSAKKCSQSVGHFYRDFYPMQSTLSINNLCNLNGW